MTKKIAGIYTPNITPTDSSGRVDEQRLCEYVDWLIERGVDGLYPNGSTGEFTRFTSDERYRVIQVLVEHVGGRIPILAGAAEPGLQETIRTCNSYADLGIETVAIVAPYYFKLSQDGVREYFRRLANEVAIDITLYNIPSFASVIDATTVRELALECPRIVGIKDSSGDLSNMIRMIEAIKVDRPDFSFLCGWEPALAPMLLAGCDGGTNATSGVAPELTKGIFEAAKKGDWSKAMELQRQLIVVFDLMISITEFPEGFRRGAKLRGWHLGQSRQPMSPTQVDVADRMEQSLARELRKLGLLESTTKL